MKKIVQIAAAFGNNSTTTVALCDDGSVFKNIPGQYPFWARLPPIPQDEEPTP